MMKKAMKDTIDANDTGDDVNTNNVTCTGRDPNANAGDGDTMNNTKGLIFFSLFDFNLVQIDIQMQSPPNSPSQGLHGASCIIGGTTCQHAHGNVFNFVDRPDLFCNEAGVRPKTGKVLLYTLMGDLETMKPATSLKHEVSPMLTPGLVKLLSSIHKSIVHFFI